MGLGLAAGVAYLLGRLVAAVLVALSGWVARRQGPGPELARSLAPVARGPGRWAITAALAGVLVRPLVLPGWLRNRADEAWSSLFVVALAVLAVRAIDAGAGVLLARLVAGTRDEGRRRGLRTQVAVLRRVAGLAIGALAGALVLTRFETLRHVGISLLASAGVLGVVCGIAAQRSLGTLLAGLQLSLAQTIRLDDAIAVAGERGTVEEIHLTHVVVGLGGGRRLVVPVPKLLEEPFQIWPRDAPGGGGAQGPGGDGGGASSGAVTVSRTT